MSVAQRRERIFNLPGAVLGVAVLLAAIHALRAYALTEAQDARVLATFAFVPGRFTLSFDPSGVADTFASFTGRSGYAQEQAARFFLGDGSLQWWTVLTYAGLHANWLHVGVNDLWLVAFGSPVARRFGTWRFLALLAVSSVAGAAMHYVFHRFDLVPVVGASAAVSGAMAAATRFVFQPRAPLGSAMAFGSGSEEAYRQPAVPLSRVFTDRRTLPFLIVWFAVNLVFGVGSAPLGITQGPVAWEAHVGGFLAGLLLFRWFDPPHPAPAEWNEPPPEAAQ
jgi:membrane associated rhomboid family serine protease